MEGLLPFLYRAIILHYVDGGRRRTPTGGSPFLCGDSPLASRYYYTRLTDGANDSGRFRLAVAQVPAFPSPASFDAQLLL